MRTITVYYFGMLHLLNFNTFHTTTDNMDVKSPYDELTKEFQSAAIQRLKIAKAVEPKNLGNKKDSRSCL